MWSFCFQKIRRNPALVKYLLTSFFVYIYILAAIYVLVDFIEMDKVSAYISVYIFGYVMEYTLTLRLVFKEEHRWMKALKYIAYVAMFLGLSTILYKLLLLIGVHYLMATLFSALALMPVRFVVNKYWVYYTAPRLGKE